jgi:hypothetical protein
MLAHNHVWGDFLKEASPWAKKEIQKTHFSQSLEGGHVILASRHFWKAKICLPRSMVKVSFQSPLAILPLMEGGGVRNWARISQTVNIRVPRSTTLK